MAFTAAGQSLLTCTAVPLYCLQMEGYLARMANRIEHDPPEALVGLEGRYQQYCQQVRLAG